MKRFSTLAIMLALVSIPSFAAKNSDNLTITDKVTVGSTQLPPASYKVTWTGTGSDVQVTISNTKNSVTVPAKLAGQKNGNTSILTDSKTGANVVQAIYLNNVTLTLSNAPAVGQ